MAGGVAYAVCMDETPLRVGPRKPEPGRKKAEKYLIVACTQLYTHYLLGDRDLDTFKASIFGDRRSRGGFRGDPPGDLGVVRGGAGDAAKGGRLAVSAPLVARIRRHGDFILAGISAGRGRCGS